MATKVAFFIPNKNGFFLFSQTLVTCLRQLGKLRMAERYTSTLNSFIRFREGVDINVRRIDSHLIQAYEEYLKSIGLCPNTTSFYMRNLRAMYNRAIEGGLALQCYPFKRVYTGIDKTVKRGISIQVVRRIRNLDLAQYPAMELARDVFMFSFYTRGMSFIDMAFLRKSDLQNGFLVYRRRKTKQQMFVKWERPMQAIVDKYDTTGSPYLLPLIKGNGNEFDERRQYINSVHLVNKKLRKIGKRLNLPISLTTYVARHGWASIAMSKNIPISTISEAMGHDSERTTRIYLSSLDTTVIDNANHLVLSSI